MRWAHNAGGKISGGAVVIGDLVFYSNLSRRSSAALGAATGKLVWSIGRGAFNPVISDGRRLYFLGYSSLFMLSSPNQAKRDERSRDQLAEAAGAGAARAKRKADKRRAQSRAHSQAQGRAAGRRSPGAGPPQPRLRREHRKICFTSHGHRVCRIPRPLVCVKQRNGRTVCRARKG